MCALGNISISHSVTALNIHPRETPSCKCFFPCCISSVNGLALLQKCFRLDDLLATGSSCFLQHSTLLVYSRSVKCYVDTRVFVLEWNKSNQDIEFLRLTRRQVAFRTFLHMNARGKNMYGNTCRYGGRNAKDNLVSSPLKWARRLFLQLNQGNAILFSEILREASWRFTLHSSIGIYLSKVVVVKWKP